MEQDINKLKKTYKKKYFLLHGLFFAYLILLIPLFTGATKKEFIYLTLFIFSFVSYLALYILQHALACQLRKIEKFFAQYEERGIETHLGVVIFNFENFVTLYVIELIFPIIALYWFIDLWFPS